LESHRRDFEETTGRPFTHFFCPILATDEPLVEPNRLIKGHIINKSFAGAPGVWVVQRSDVDNFYGSVFEADFELIQYRDQITPLGVLGDKKLSKKFGSKILLEGQEIPYRSKPSKPVPGFARVGLGDGPSPPMLEINMTPETLAASAHANWEFVMVKDLRIATFVSLIKAAHLILFHLLGYRYATSAAGLLVGRDILGQFFKTHVRCSRTEVLSNAWSHFKEFAHMFRPLKHVDVGYQGTLADHMLLLCHSTSGGMWAKIVLVKLADQMHAVMIPLFTSSDSVPTFLEFMKNENEQIQVSTAEFFAEDQKWIRYGDRREMIWPKQGLIYPSGKDDSHAILEALVRQRA
jgi:hypothetical protein